jgi:hypothetical protein
MLSIGIFIFFIIYNFFYKKNKKALYKHLFILFIIFIFFIISFKVSKLDIPEIFKSHELFIAEAKNNIFLKLSFNDYFMRIIFNWYPFYFIFFPLYTYILYINRKNINLIYLVFFIL